MYSSSWALEGSESSLWTFWFVAHQNTQRHRQINNTFSASNLHVRRSADLQPLYLLPVLLLLLHQFVLVLLLQPCRQLLQLLRVGLSGSLHLDTRGDLICCFKSEANPSAKKNIALICAVLVRFVHSEHTVLLTVNATSSFPCIIAITLLYDSCLSFAVSYETVCLCKNNFSLNLFLEDIPYFVLELHRCQ